MNSEKLLKCMMTDAPKPLTDEQIAAAEKKLGLRFPAEFKRFFAKWNGAEFEGFDGSFCLALDDLSNPSFVREKYWDEIFCGEEWEEAFPDIDSASVDLIPFGSDHGEALYILMVDKKDPEKYQFIETFEFVFWSRASSIPAFLNEFAICGKWQDDRTLSQKLADRIHGEKPTVFMICRLEDASEVKAPGKIAFDTQKFAVVMPSMGYGIQMMRVHGDANGGRPFWISRFPVPNDRFYPLIHLRWSGDEENTDQNNKYPAVVSAADAESFCAILNDFFAESLPDGYAFALPTEAEYQRAIKCEKKHFFFNTPRPSKVLLKDAPASEKLPFYIVLTSR